MAASTHRPSVVPRKHGFMRSPGAWLVQLIQRAQPYPEDEQLAARHRALQLGMVARLGVITIPSQLICGLALAWMLREVQPTFIAAWCGVLLLFGVASVARVRRNAHLDQATQRNLCTGSALIVAVACLWGSLPIMTITSAPQAAQLPLLLAMILVCSGGSIVFQTMPVAAAGWVLVLTTSIVWSVVQLEHAHALGMSVFAAFYAFVLLRNVWMTSSSAFLRQKMSERSQRLSDALRQQAQVVQSTSNGVLMLDRRGRVVWANNGFLSGAGYPKCEVIGSAASTWLVGEGQAVLVKRLHRDLKRWRQAKAEVQFLHKNGQVHWAKLELKCLLDQDSRVERFVVIATDISELKRATLALNAEQERQRQIIDGTHCGTWETDFNMGACKLGGHWWDIIGVDTATPLVAEGRFLMARIHQDDRQGHEAAIRRYIKGEDAQYEHEHRLQHEDGSWRWVSARGKASAYDRDGRIAKMVGISMDISKRKSAELALIEATRVAKHENHAKSIFLATMSHEIRTPMNGVIGTAEWLKLTHLDDEQRDGIQTIVASGQSLLRIIDDILDFSKVDAGRMKLDALPVSPLELAEGVADAIAPVACARQVDLHVFVDPNVPRQVLGDPNRLRQVLFNLVGNAVKFGCGSEGRRGQVDMQILCSDEDQGVWQMQISDDGIGMDKATVQKLFKPFTQAEASTTRRFGGTGLGLAICHRLVVLMGGGISVHSVPGHGSTFTVTLPLHVPESDKESGSSDVDLRGVDCLLLPGRNFQVDAYAAYLAHAGAVVHHCSAFDDVRLVSQGMRVPVLIKDSPDPTSPVPEPQGHADHADLAHLSCLLIGRYQHGPMRLVSPSVGQLGRAHAQDLLRAVAVLAGRRAPEMAQGTHSGFDGHGAAVAAASAGAGSSARLVLIAEDDPINRKVIKRQMGMLGVACEMASDGAEALALWRGRRFDLVLSDLHMPEMDGYDLARCIRSDEAELGLGRTPIIAVTANALKGEERRALDCGMDGYLTKPLALKSLDECLRRWLTTPDAHLRPLPAVGAPPWAGAPRTGVDLSVLRGLVGDDEDVIRALLEDFEASSRGIGQRLTSAFESKAHHQVQQLAHQLKSAARSVGALHLGQLCEALEDQARSQRACTGPYPALMRELEHVHTQLERLTTEFAK